MPLGFGGEKPDVSCTLAAYNLFVKALTVSKYERNRCANFRLLYVDTIHMIQTDNQQRNGNGHKQR